MLSHSPSIITDGLVLYLDAANRRSYPGSGSTFFNLISLTNNGSLVNSPVFSPSNAGIFNFNGWDTRIDVAYSSANFVNTNFTWSIWILGSVANNGPMPAVGYGSFGWNRLGFRQGSASRWYFSQYGNSGIGNIDVDIGPISNLDWINLTISANYSLTNIRSYRNGRLFSSVNGWRDSTGNSGDLGLGRPSNTAWPNAVLLGSIACFSVYNKSLTASEVLNNYNATKGRFEL
jgi:hypothetical protein